VTSLPLPLLTLAVLIGMSAVMGAAWLTQKRLRNTGWVDVFWTFGTGMSGAVCALLPADGALPARQFLAAALIAVWALRLGGYITLRVARSDEEDSRYRQFRKDWGKTYDQKMFWFLQIQAFVTAGLALSVALAARIRATELGMQDVLAVAIFIIAVAGESLADRQMKRFKADPANKGKICDTGLWGVSRHPNYFFEWLSWFTWPVMAASLGAPLGLISLLAPALMFLVLRFGSGVPPLEQTMAKSRGAAFDAYAKRVPVFIPGPSKGA
jgi:steroid 5-alpha reductase family enzyme